MAQLSEEECPWRDLGLTGNHGQSIARQRLFGVRAIICVPKAPIR
jgi:hypothetical protein